MRRKVEVVLTLRRKNTSSLEAALGTNDTLDNLNGCYRRRVQPMIDRGRGEIR